MNAYRFLENSNSATGDKIATASPDNPVSAARRKGLSTLRKIASSKGDTVLDTAITVLGGAGAELARYIQAKGIAPSESINKMIAQAALLRLKDIGQTALIFNTTDLNALKELEEAEAIAIQTGSSDADNVMNPQVQAALTVVIESILRKAKKATGVATASGFVKALSGNEKGIGDYNSNYNVNNLLVKGAANSATGDPGGSNSVMDWINTITAAFSTIMTTIKSGSKQIGDAAKDIVGGIKDEASDVGADSLAKFFGKYKWYFIGFLVIIIVIVLIAVYGRRK